MVSGRRFRYCSFALSLLGAFLPPCPALADDLSGSLFGSLFGSTQTGAQSAPTTNEFNFAGFKEAPAAMSLRIGGQKGEGGSEGVLNFWLDIPAGTLKTGQMFDVGPWGDYGLIEKPMMWDMAGYISGGYTKTTRTRQRLSDYRLWVEKFDVEFGTWNTVSQSQGGTGQFSFSDEGYYRIVVVPNNTVFVSKPMYGVVTVTDPKHDRAGSLIYFEVMGQGPANTTGGFTVDGAGKPQRDSGGVFRPDCGERHEVSALAKQGRVQWESSGNRMIQDATPWQAYRRATWILRDTATGKILDRLEKTTNEFGSYVFNANHWRDGNYLLEIHLAREHQASGINQLPVPPSQYYIHVYNCGQGQRPGNVVDTKTPAGGPTKADEVAYEPPPFAQLDADNVLQHPVMAIPPLLIPGAPNDTPNPPVKLSDDCPDLQKQIIHRNKQLQIPCDPPLLLMEQMLAAPKRQQAMLKDYAREWDAALKALQEARQPFATLAERYQRLVVAAYQNGLVVSAADQAKYRPMNADGSPAVIGNGLPVGFFVFEPEKIALATKLREEQKAIYEAWAGARLEAGRKLAERKAAVEKANQRFADYDQALREMQTDLAKMQGKLVDLYFSGLYEHCLGSGGIRTSGDYQVRDAQGKVQNNPALGLPGMGLQLPEPAKKKLGAEVLDIPKPLHEILPLKLKQDGAKQLASDRKLMQSLADAAYLQYYAENGTWLNWVGSRLEWLSDTSSNLVGTATGTKYMSQLLSDIASGKSVDQALNDANGQFRKDFGWVGDAAQAVHDGIFVRPATEVSKQIGDTLWNVTGAVLTSPSDALADYLHMRRDVLPELEATMDELNRLAGLGDDPRVETQRLALLQRQLQLWKGMEKGVDGMDNLILTVATSATVLKGVSAAAAEIEQATAKLSQFLAEGRLAAQQAGNALKNQAVLEATLKHLDEVGDGALAGNSALDAARTTTQAGQKMEDILRAQQSLAKEANGLLDDAARKVQDQIARTDPPKNWAPMKERIEVPPEQYANATLLGSGTAGKVMDLGDGKVIKTFGGDMAEQKLQHEIQGLQTLRDADIPHIKAEGVAVTRETPLIPGLDEGREVKGIVKEKFTSAQQTMEKVIEQQGGKMTRQQQIEALEYYNQAAKKGVVFADPNAGNLVREVMPDGNVRYLATEGGGVLKTDPATARKMMDLMLTDDLGGDLAIMGREYHGNLFVDNAGKLIGEQKAKQILTYGGASFKDANIASKMDPDLLQAFKDPAKWEQMVAESRRAQTLTNLEKLDPAARAKLSELTRLQSENASILNQQIQQNGAALEQARQQLDQVIEQQAGQIRQAGEKAQGTPPTKPGLPPISLYPAVPHLAIARPIRPHSLRMVA